MMLPDKDRRLVVSVPSSYQARLINLWASSIERPKSSLGLMIFEKGFEAVQAQGLIPQSVLNQVNDEFFGKEEQ